MSDFELWSPKKKASKKAAKKVSACIGADFELWAPEAGALLDSEFDDIDPAFIVSSIVGEREMFS